MDEKDLRSASRDKAPTTGFFSRTIPWENDRIVFAADRRLTDQIARPMTHDESGRQRDEDEYMELEGVLEGIDTSGIMTRKQDNHQFHRVEKRVDELERLVNERSFHGDL